MLFFINHIIFIITISSIIYLLNYFISMIKSFSYEKNMFYECGFNPITKANLPFSLPFYMITLMFLIFDVEIILLLPLINFMFKLNMYMNFIMFFFIFMLIMTLLYELLMGFLKWLF